MTIPRFSRLLPDQLLAPRSVVLLGAGTPHGARIVANMHAAAFHGDFWPLDDAACLPNLPAAPELAIIASTGAHAEADITAVAARGTRAAIAVSHVPNLAGLARAAGLRVMGPDSFGLAVPKLGLNATLSHIPIPRGHVALVTQSSSLARAVIDWAEPSFTGFSHIIGIGGNEETGFAMVLDFLARDPDTKLILIDIRRVRDARLFISAARAASRLRPMVALRPGGRLLDETGQAEAVFEAALTRAGIFTVQTLESFLTAAITLPRTRPLRADSLAVVTNAIGPGRLAAGAALQAGITLATLPSEAQTALSASLPADLVQGLIYAGSETPTNAASAAAMAAAVPDIGAILLVLAPTGPADPAGIEAAIAAADTARIPMLTCVMGETTGAAGRQRLAASGLPTFATPEAGVQAFHHMLRNRHARLAARELPDSRVLELRPSQAQRCALLAAVRAGARRTLTRADSFALLRIYGLASRPGLHEADDTALTNLMVMDDAVFGPAISLTLLPSLLSSGAPATGLPPLNLPLAQALARGAGLADPALLEAASNALVRISQLLIDTPEILTLSIPRLRLSAAGATVEDASITLRQPGEQSRLAIAPYPDHLIEHWVSHGQSFTIRPIRPEDAAAHADFIRRVPPEDLRYRFFTALRQVSPEQMARLTQIDYDREMAFIAVRARDTATMGVARLVRDTENTGEFAILVAPDSKGFGLARHLMERLIAWARGQGIMTITGQILADNHKMLGFIKHIGFTLHALPDEADVLEARLLLTT